MVKHYKQWEDFQDLAFSIIENDPFKTRVVTKYNHTKNILIVKVTDDRNIVLSKLKKPEDFESFEKFFVVAAKMLSNNQWVDQEPIKEEKQNKKNKKKEKKKGKK